MCVRKYKDQIYSECVFPKLEQPFERALSDAVKLVLKKFSVQGILFTGSLIQGGSYKSSDLGIFVVNNRLERQRIQKLFNGVPAEIFISPAKVIKQEMEDGRDNGSCTTANMFSSGFVIYDQNQLVYKLRNKANEVISRGPSNSEFKLQLIRYRIADVYENAVDVMNEDPYNAIILMSNAVYSAILYRFRILGEWQPRAKEIMPELKKSDEKLFNLVKSFYDSPDFKDKFKAAEKIMDITIKTHGFFEWESEIEIQKE